MTIHELLLKARSCRRFKGDYLSKETLYHFVEAARISSSARNRQILRFAVIFSKESCEEMDSYVRLGGSLTPEQRAKEHQHPRGFIVIYGSEEKDFLVGADTGIAAQSIHLAAAEQGIADVLIQSVNYEKAKKFLGIPDDFNIYLAIAFGEPDEKHKIVEPSESGKLTYYRDKDDTHCVPKLPLSSLILIEK